MKDFLIFCKWRIFIFFVNEGFLYFVEWFLYFVEGFLYFVEGFLYLVNEGFLYFVEWFLYFVDEGFLYFVDEGFLYFIDEGFLYFEDMNVIDKSHFLCPIKEQLTKNLIQWLWIDYIDWKMTTFYETNKSKFNHLI